MGLSSLGFLIYSHGEVKLLVVMYSINVFLTFTLSQLGYVPPLVGGAQNCEPWKLKLVVNGLGLLSTRMIFFVTVTTKFVEGGWVTIVVTLVFVLICQAVRWHYDRVKLALKSLDDTLMGIPFQPALNAAGTRQGSQGAHRGDHRARFRRYRRSILCSISYGCFPIIFATSFSYPSG